MGVSMDMNWLVRPKERDTSEQALMDADYAYHLSSVLALMGQLWRHYPLNRTKR